VTPEKYIAKAVHASRSACLLLEAGENEGACNRAYYAMFNAAHAALPWSGAHINPAETKKHNSLIAAFGRHLVPTGLLPSELGKSLNRAESIRILADYTGEEIEHQKAAEIVELGRLFINVIEEKFCPAARLAGRSRPDASP
jgi:uncharacterized protein (UPF0332 family)